MPDVLAPGVVRVDTDTDQTPIGACWGKDLPNLRKSDQWWWRRVYVSEGPDGTPFWYIDTAPALNEWVQCRPPASPKTPGRWVVGGEVPHVHVGYEYDDTWTPLGAQFTIREDAERVADALNAAESSTTRTEARQALWDVYGILGFDQDGDKTPHVTDLEGVVRRAAEEFRRDYDQLLEQVGEGQASKPGSAPEGGPHGDRHLPPHPSQGSTSSYSASSPVVDREPEADGVLLCDACGHPLIRHGRLLEGWPCREVYQDDDGEWVDCSCKGFVNPSVSPVPQPDPDEHRTTVTTTLKHGEVRWVVVPNDWPKDTEVVVRRSGNKEADDA